MWVMSSITVTELNRSCLAVAFLLVSGCFFTKSSLPDHFAVAEIDGNTYWRHPFNSLFHPKQLEEFIIMDINRVQEKKKGAGAGARSNKVRVSLFNLCFGPPAQLTPCSGCAWHSHSGLFWVLPLAEAFLGTFGLEMAQAGCEFHFQEFLMQSLNSACYWVLRY